MRPTFHPRGAVLPLAALALGALALAPALPVAAESDGRPVRVDPVDLASVSVFSSGIDLRPMVPYERALVTVSGMGRTYSLEFDAHQLPEIGAFTLDGELLADGVYTWELDLFPDAESARALRRSAAANGGVAPRPWLPESGAFAIRGGAFATPDVIEPGAVREREAPVVSDRGGRPALGAPERAAAIDRDGAGVSEASVSARAAAAPSTQTGLDSDHQAAVSGLSLEPALVPVLQPHELAAAERRPVADGDAHDGRPRSDR